MWLHYITETFCCKPAWRKHFKQQTSERGMIHGWSQDSVWFKVQGVCAWVCFSLHVKRACCVFNRCDPSISGAAGSTRTRSWLKGACASGGGGQDECMRGGCKPQQVRLTSCLSVAAPSHSSSSPPLSLFQVNFTSPTKPLVFSLLS